ncbi:cGMP-dependent protein kinase, isozyme 1-like [Harmonia axyridis]|uniref:cGMP-dependent protein kinase, isozyme 1-like n=1 Tax=Harmonia axyridis TaxID=115357 RepID=UPI001E27543C|nr:cGMP-dependent protein kinase, isozyme 1-like [Harmonia axyridis]
MRNNLKMKALTNCKVWILLQNAFRSIIKESGENIENLEFLKTFPWFRNVDDEVLSKISAANKLLYFGTNEVLDLQVNTLYIISKGNIKLIKKKIGLVKNKNISRVMSRGDHFEGNTESSYDFIVFSPGVELLSFDMEYLQQLIGGSEYFRQETVAWGPFQNTGGLYREEFSEMKFEDLNILGNLGEGSFGRVDLVSYSKDPSKQFALKRVSKHRTVDIRQEGYVLDERKILFSCEHPFIIRLYKTFRSNRYIYMLFEAGHGGEVFEVMKKHDRFDNETARFISASALEALDYLHKRDLIYRDLKPDNMVIDRYGFVKLIDFGLSKHLGFTGRTWSFCGSPFIMAPEIILKIGHDRAVDIWAFGVLIYELLSGHNLFSTVNPMKAYSQIITGIEKVKFPYQLWGLPAEDLVRNLCKKEPNERLGYRRIDDIRKHRWFEGFNWSGLISQTMKPPKILVPKSQNIHAMNLVLNEDKPPPTPPKEMSNWDEIFA